MPPTTPVEWRDELAHRLHQRWNAWRLFDAYYEGDHRLAAWLTQVQRAFSGTVLGNLLSGLTDNYMPLVVDAAAERLRVQGFRFGGGDEADDDAWAIWQANGLDAQSNMVHTEAIKLGEAYWMVTPNGGQPSITAEHPSQVIVATSPGNRRERLAALKMWQDGDFTYANVYLPSVVHKYRKRTRKEKSELALPVFTRERLDEWREIDRVRNSLGVVPIVPMPNNPSMLRGGQSDLSFGAVGLQDQITKAIADLMIGAEYQGFPQRVLLGVEPPRDENGRVISGLEAARNRVWYFASKDAKATEFSQADLKALRDSADGFIGDLAAQTRIPIYYFRPQAISNIGAETLIGLDAGLVSKTNDKKEPLGEGHEETMRLAFASIDANDPRAQATDAETMWADTESRSRAQVTDAVSKEVAMGLPFEAALEKLGYSPQAIDRIRSMQETEALLAEALTPGPVPVPSTNGAVPVNAGQPN